MEALKRSLAAEEANPTPAKQGTAKKPKKAAAGQREMLLPIAGQVTSRAEVGKPANKAAHVKANARQRRAG